MKFGTISVSLVGTYLVIYFIFILLKFSIGFSERQGLGGSASFSTLLGVGTLVNFVGELPLHGCALA